MQGRSGLNRAVDGDIVAVEVFDKKQWTAPSDIILEDECTPETAVEDVLNKENELKNASVGKDKDVRPTGRVVGIIRRRWRQYCGILQPGSFDSLRQLLFLLIGRSQRLGSKRDRLSF